MKLSPFGEVFKRVTGSLLTLSTSLACPDCIVCCAVAHFVQAGVYGDLQNNLQVGAQHLMDCHIAPELYVAQVITHQHMTASHSTL